MSTIRKELEYLSDMPKPKYYGPIIKTLALLAFCVVIVLVCNHGCH